jgi:hypothetical protein
MIVQILQRVAITAAATGHGLGLPAERLTITLAATRSESSKTVRLALSGNM